MALHLKESSHFNSRER